MKKGLLIFGMSSLFFMSCGDDTQESVCECSKLYDEWSATADKAEENGEDWVDAYQAAQEAAGEKAKQCEKIHKEVGDEKFYEMSKECK